MKRLLTIELQKLWSNRASRILVLTYFILLTFIALLSSVNFSFLGMDFRLADMGIFNFPYIWHLNTWIASLLKFFLAVVIVSMMANEYTYGTLKQNLIDGLSKKEFIASKFITVTLFAAISTIFIFILTLVLGYSFSSYTELSIVTTDLIYLLAYFLKLVAFFAFCLYIGILIKRSAFAIGFVFVWWIAEGIMKGVLWKIFKDMDLVNRILGFFPLEAMSNLIKEPITRIQAYKAIEAQVSGKEELKFYGVHWYEIVIVLAWIAIFVYLSYRTLKKRDL